MLYHDSILQESNRDCPAISDSLDLMRKNEFPESEIAAFEEKAVLVLDNCTRNIGAGTRYRYTITEHLGRI